MFERLLAALLAPCWTAALLACVPGPNGAVASSSSTVHSARATPAADGIPIQGQWDIVSFNGYTPKYRLRGTDRGAYADFQPGEVWLMIECNASSVPGSVRDSRFLSRQGDRVQTVVGCGPIREARDAALFGFFERKPRVDLFSDGRLRLTAGDDVLVLERPETRRLAYLPSPQQLLGEWRLLAITHYVPGGGIVSAGLGEVQSRIEFDGIEARVTACPASVFRYRYAPEGRIEKMGDASASSSADGCHALRGDKLSEDSPQPADVLRVLHANPLVELVDEDTILLSTDRYGVLLTKRPPEA